MQVIDFYAPTLRSEGPHIGLPACALMVDDFGLRWLITDFPVPEGMWRRALASGAHGIMWNGGQCYAEEVAQFPTSQGMLLAPPLIAPPAAILTRPFVHLHAHSEYSSLDGYGRIEEMVDVVAADGQDTMALTDHGVCAGHLELQKVARKKGIKPIFGVEAYLVPEARDKSRETYQSYWHFILLAKNKVGLHNLWRASTLAHSPDRFYGRPRMDWEVLRQCSEGVIASSACLRGPLSHLIEDDDEQGAREMLWRMSAIFGDDLYLELHTNQLDRQKVVNRGLVSLGREMGIPLIVVGDSHYACSSDQEAHQVWIAAQTDKTLADESDLFAGHEEYHLHSAAEVADAIAYLGTDVADAAIAMTVEVASRCDASATGRNITPVYHRKHVAHSEHQGGELDYDVMESICERAWADRVPPEALIGGEAHSVYRARLAEELAEFRTKKFSGYMLIVWDYMNWCRENRILVGPGRGSAAGSLVCFLMGITQIDPIEGGLLFERFISPGRTQLPDVDSDFPTSKRGAVTDYIVQRWGADHAVRVGTVTRLRNKGTFKEVAKVFKGSEREVPFVAQAEVSEIITRAESGTAGMGLSWDDLWTQVGTDLAPYAEAYPDWFRFAAQLVGRLKSYGKHPAGIVIDPEESLIDLLPLRQGEDDHPITEFPMDQLDELGFVKFDILTVRTLDTIQETMDLIDSDARYTGRIPHPHTWRRQEYADPMVWEMLRRGETLGIFQIETGEGTRLVNQFRPESLADLCAILTLVRPGPKNSGLTASYLRRRDGVEHVSYIHPLLEAVLSDTYGCMVYQEDIMNTVKVIAGYTSAEADEVRSILGKKKVDKIAAEGTRFVSRSLGMGIDQAIADTIFEQMAEFAKYSFNKSHSLAYAVLAFWCAWYKVHFPIHFLVACLSTADKDRFPEFVADARRRGYRIDLPDVNESKVTFSVSSDGMGIRYGLSSVKSLGTKAAADVMANAPYSSWADFVERRGKACNWGHIKVLVSVGALDALIPAGHNRLDLEAVCNQMADGKIEQCRWLRDGHQPSMGVPSCCAFNWESEERPIGKSGKPLKGKPTPKACTKACRQYDAVTAISWPHNADLTPVQVRRAERESFGLYVTSTPFDALNLDGLPTLSEMTVEGNYQVVGEIQSVRKRPDSLNRIMAFMTVAIPDGSIDVVCFSKKFAQLEEVLRPDAFGVFSVERNKRGFSLNQYVPMRQE